MDDSTLVAGFATLDTATVSDALDRLGLGGQVPGIYPVDARSKLCGRAHTLRYESVDEHGGTVGDFIDDVDPTNVLVLDNGGRLDCTVWGDLLTAAASRRGVRGTVIDGVCRDVAHSTALGYPLFSRGRWMRTGKDRVRLAEQGGSVGLGGVQVNPGDLLLGDTDGVVVVTWSAAVDVLAAATEIGTAEDGIRKAIEAGVRLADARRDAGYHNLQSAIGTGKPQP
jgi:regulator of RNase E activity RraA